jgi:RNA polymerase sigma-70 factor (ECF subfamily)
MCSASGVVTLVHSEVSFQIFVPVHFCSQNVEQSTADKNILDGRIRRDACGKFYARSVHDCEWNFECTIGLKQRFMGSPFQDSALAMTGAAIEVATDPAAGVTLEDEVVKMYDQFREHLLRYLLALGVGISDAEEVVQEVFLALFQHLQRRKPRHNLRSWIFRVAHNLGLKQRGRDRRQLKHIVKADALTQIHLDPRPNPEEQLLFSDRQQRLRAVLEGLPERDQWCLYLRAEGLRYREIAQVLGISLGAVSLVLARSLARLGRVDRY